MAGHHVRGYSNEKHQWLFLTHEVYVLEEKAVTKMTEVDFLQDVSQRPLLLNVHILVLCSPTFQQVWFVQSVAYSRSDAMSHPRSGYEKDINFCLRCSLILFITSSVGSVMYVDTQAACGEAHLTRNKLRPADNHTSEFGNGSFSPLEPWDDCSPGQCVDCTFISWKILSRPSS